MQSTILLISIGILVLLFLFSSYSEEGFVRAKVSLASSTPKKDYTGNCNTMPRGDTGLDAAYKACIAATEAKQATADAAATAQLQKDANRAEQAAAADQGLSAPGRIYR